jgi:tRNA U54 and U55 pseudouridine synthase Pus10
MQGALKLVEKSLIKKLVAGDTKVIDALKPMTSYIKTSEVPQFCFVYTLKETKEYNVDNKTGILRNDIYIKLIKNKDNFTAKTGNDFGRFLTRLTGNKVEIGDIVDTENCVYYKMTDTKIADYNNMVVVALQDLTFFSSVNGVKTTNFINALEQGYKNHFGSDLPTIA